MKLGGVGVFVLLVGLVGCSSTPRAASPREVNAVGTTEITAAEVRTAPHVEKAQSALPAEDDRAQDAQGEKVQPKRTDKRPGGGFSGYK
jgi:hypothetical protein